MSKKTKNQGKIRDNALKASLYDPMFRQRVVKAKKGKVSYSRKGKQGAWLSGFQQAA